MAVAYYSLRETKFHESQLLWIPYGMALRRWLYLAGFYHALILSQNKCSTLLAHTFQELVVVTRTHTL